ncbi:MAG TPA: histidinol dehydrogenase [Candidatus Saccharimonadales bacterium]|nr:histidinol dehydrogenase [Candidatus Saccharimonadales bacterium]
MKIYKNPARSRWGGLCARPAKPPRALDAVVAEVFDKVAAKGDEALKAYTRRFDGVSIDKVAMPAGQVERLAGRVSPDLRRAIDQAYENIRKFHQSQEPTPRESIETFPGVLCWRERRAIERVGLYVPGGSAPLVSTVLMLGVPAQLAGCQAITLCTPPTPDGTVGPAICYAALKIGATTVVRVGGIQAIAALAIGTESVGRVDKIFGPGNQYVTAAKQYAASNARTAIDMPAGPSEVLVVADGLADPEFVASDLLSQAEHGPDSQAVLLTDDYVLARAVKKAAARQLKTLPRSEITGQALSGSFCVVFDSIGLALEFSNAYAPEHLILAMRKAGSYVNKVSSAGSVFVGDYSPVTAGDYASGTNHTLPTDGWARSSSGVSLDSFVKQVTFQKLTRKGLSGLAPTITVLAQAEGLEAHARSVRLRLEEI